ncbi:MAG: hypothetical protein AMJ79_09665 [Phycisphaerae bacterium SM23_30]|nr:MAG: hypothetical protein AMJ79_09665 [Phycisphaerae bacterium SM23_30]
MEEQPGRVDITANRLRMIQVDFADESDQVRQEYLAEEIERALAGLVPEQRQAFLQELMTRFPTWDHHVKTPPDQLEPQDVVQSLLDRRELQDPAFLLARLAEIAPALAQDQKQHLISGLMDLQLAPARAGFSTAAEEKLRKTLALAEADLEPDRLAELTVLLAEFAGKLEPLVWRIWHTLAPHSKIRRPVELKKAIHQFFRGDQLETYKELSGVLETLRQLTASLISAVGQADNLFAQKHARRFSPGEIEGMVKLEHKGLLTSHEVRCWRKFVELADKFDAATIESEIRKAIVDCTESLLKGTQR